MIIKLVSGEVLKPYRQPSKDKEGLGVESKEGLYTIPYTQIAWYFEGNNLGSEGKMYLAEKGKRNMRGKYFGNIAQKTTEELLKGIYD